MDLHDESLDPDAETRTRALIANERAKLTATYANGLAISIFAIGGLAPVFNVYYGAGPSSVPASAVFFSAGVCFREWCSTSFGAAISWEAPTMNTLDFYGLFAMPAAGLLIVGFLLWYTRRAH